MSCFEWCLSYSEFVLICVWVVVCFLSGELQISSPTNPLRKNSAPNSASNSSVEIEFKAELS